MTPEQEAEAIQIELELRRRKAASGQPAAQTASTQNSIEPTAGAAPQLPPQAQALMDIGWDNMGATERMELIARVNPEFARQETQRLAKEKLLAMAHAFPTYAKQEILGVGKETGGFAARAAGPAIGQKVGRMTRIPLVDRFLGAIGGAVGEAAGQQIEDEPFSPGRILGAAFAGGVTGKPLANATTREVAIEGAKYAGTNVVSKALETGLEGKEMTAKDVGTAVVGGAVGAVAGRAIDRGIEAASALAQVAKRAPAEAVVQEARKRGYVFLPAKVGGGAIGDVAGTAMENSAIANVASQHNQKITDDLVTSYIKARKDMPLDEVHIAMMFHEAEEPYRNVAALSSQAAATLDIFKQAKSDAKKAWRAFDRNPSPELQKFANENDQMAELAMDDLIDQARLAGKPGLIPQLEKARVELAKLHLVDRSMNYGDFHASARTFANAFDNTVSAKGGSVLTDEAELIARMYKAFPGIMRDASSITTVGSGRLPIVSAAARAVTLSPIGQRMVQIGRSVPIPQDTAAVGVRSGAMAEGRDTDESKP